MIAAAPIAAQVGSYLASAPNVLYPPTRVSCRPLGRDTYSCATHSHLERVGANWQDTVTWYRVTVRRGRIESVRSVRAIA